MKSSRSNPNGECVDVELDDNGNVVVTHSATKDLQHGTRIVYTPGEWNAFLAGVADGEFTLERLREAKAAKAEAATQ